MRALIILGLLGYLVWGYPSDAETMTVPFLCHNAEDALNFAILLDNGVDNQGLLEAGTALILDGKCVYLPGPVEVEKEDTVDTKALKFHEVWKVKAPGDTEWYALHKKRSDPA